MFANIYVNLLTHRSPLLETPGSLPLQISANNLIGTVLFGRGEGEDQALLNISPPKRAAYHKLCCAKLTPASVKRTSQCNNTLEKIKNSYTGKI